MRLLINDVINLDGKPHFVKLGLFRVPIRLGWDVFNDGKISDHNIQRLTSALTAYKNFIDAYQVDNFRACATSAMRDASNSKEIIAAIQEATKRPPRRLSCSIATGTCQTQERQPN